MRYWIAALIIVIAAFLVVVVVEVESEVMYDPPGSNCIDAECSNHHGKDVQQEIKPVENDMTNGK